MGCASSKQSRCRHCQSPYSPICRSYSMHVHHPPLREGDSYHVVALTSTTLGSLKLDPSKHNTIIDDDQKISNHDQAKEFSMGIIEAKTWSSMIDEKIPKIIPKTPIRTPPGEPETINTWELMEGLEDNSPLRLPNLVGRCFSFHAVPDSVASSPRLQENGVDSPKPLWLQMADKDVISTKPESEISDFDPDVIYSFRKALEELSPTNPFRLRSVETEKPATCEKNHLFSKDGDDPETGKLKGDMEVIKCPPGGEDRVVLYLTSLRGVRKTYEDCCQVRMILKGMGVRLEERDVSMDFGFREELKELLGLSGLPLPRVFVKGRYIGGAEEVRQLHDDGKLEKVLEGCEMVDEGGGGGGVCEACGDIRFVPCERCSGSCKIYYDDENEGEEEEDEVVGEYGFKRCPNCNENGIVRCPFCC